MSRAIQVVRWDSPALPEGLDALLAEAIAAGIGWIERFKPEWDRNPALGPGEALFLALQNGLPIAMTGIAKDRQADDPQTGRLRFVFVRATARQQGLAEALVLRCLAVGDTHWDRVTLHTDNPIAEALYLRHGFVALDAPGRTTHVRVKPAAG